MSHIISRAQYKNTKEKEEYRPLEYIVDGLTLRKVNVKFGHPLYSEVIGIYYVESNSDEDEFLPVIPDGCNNLLIRSKGGKADGFICGSIDEIKKIQVEPGERIYFIKFRPGVGHSLLDSRNEKMTNNVRKLKDCLRNAEQILSAASGELPAEQVAGIISMLIRAELYKEKRLYLIKFCTEKIINSDGNISIHGLADDTGFTERHISKMFDIYVGLSPKLFSQIIRLQNTMKQITFGGDEPLVDIAVANGFFDHAHMNRTYNKFIHCSSGDFRQYAFAGLNFDGIDLYVDAV